DNGNSIKMIVKGDGFLYNMVRIMVGTLLSVNEGLIKIDELPDIMAAGERRFAGKTAQAHGLYLNKVFY
ncbi:MAG TPA: tRNA pseudouridine(38-40) synthase TruA, partial [Ruminococcus sp.]|nr:tRNA pseudouridine(38-40) synthase TruA [Ruminococcus sp.]